MPFSFVPRATFTPPASLPRSYYLGHHAAGLAAMKQRLSAIDLVIECRDARVPLTSRNPLFEDALEGRPRVVVYTKSDLLDSSNRAREARRQIARWNEPDLTFFTSVGGDRTKVRENVHPGSVRALLSHCVEETRLKARSLTGAYVMLVGMPNVGKSSLLNALRFAGVRKGKAAKTGSEPGVTLRIGTYVKVWDADRADKKTPPQNMSYRDGLRADDGGSDGAEATMTAGGLPIHEGVRSVYLADTPGVFMPYVPDGSAMLKLALCGCVKESLIEPELLADYLLYQLNLFDPTVYHKISSPTNDVIELLTRLGQRQGKLKRKGIVDTNAAAVQFIQAWRQGKLGRFHLDDLRVGMGRVESREMEEGEAKLLMSYNQARKADRAARIEKNRSRFGAPTADAAS